MSADHFTASATDDPHRLVMTASPEACAGFFGRRWLMGGVSFGACLDALERTTQRPLVWASGQFLSSAAEGEQLDLMVEPLVEGGAVTQARALVTCGDRTVVVGHGCARRSAGLSGPAACQDAGGCRARRIARLNDEPYPDGPDIRNHFDRLDVPTRARRHARLCLPVVPLQRRTSHIADISRDHRGLPSRRPQHGRGVVQLRQTCCVFTRSSRPSGCSRKRALPDFRPAFSTATHASSPQDGTFLASAGQSAAMPRRFKQED